MRVTVKENVEVTADVNELAEIFEQLDDTGLEDSDPNKRSLSKLDRDIALLIKKFLSTISNFQT